MLSRYSHAASMPIQDDGHLRLPGEDAGDAIARSNFAFGNCASLASFILATARRHAKDAL
jgi:hypothetical protein